MDEDREILQHALSDFIFASVIDSDYMKLLENICEIIANHLTDEGVATVTQAIKDSEDVLVESIVERHPEGEDFQFSEELRGPDTR